MSERWRTAVQAHAEEAYEESAEGFERGVVFTIMGSDQFEVADRMGRGEICTNCLTPFPAAPSISTRSAFREMNFDGLRTMDEALALVSQGRCPVCCSEVSPELFEALHRGVRPVSERGGA